MVHGKHVAGIAMFTIRNYLNGALLYYHHLCQRGRNDVIEEELYKGTSKSAEGYAARITFWRSKEEGMQVSVHWQDADSSSAKAFREVFPDAEIMICGGRAHKNCTRKRKPLLKRLLQSTRLLFLRWVTLVVNVRAITVLSVGA